MKHNIPSHLITVLFHPCSNIWFQKNIDSLAIFVVSMLSFILSVCEYVRGRGGGGEVKSQLKRTEIKRERRLNWCFPFNHHCYCGNPDRPIRRILKFTKVHTKVWKRMSAYIYYISKLYMGAGDVKKNTVQAMAKPSHQVLPWFIPLSPPPIRMAHYPHYLRWRGLQLSIIIITNAILWPLYDCCVWNYSPELYRSIVNYQSRLSLLRWMCVGRWNSDFWLGGHGFNCN